ncbi:MAG: Rpn family recombination-promoting nuclease/putative transposase [Cytophagales bacterium]|nr:MAG: Rpn family recombination-promoting nuclease/putative transposase [Cytophagales bacterium]
MNKKLIKFDWAIKKLLRNKANFGILEGFLSELLFENIKIDQILESEGNQEHETDKFNRVDILTQNSKNEFVIIEIQSTYEIDYFHRMVYGASKIITENLDSGQKYADIKKVISIHIVFFDLGQGNDYIYKGITDFKGIHQNDILGLSAKQKNTFGKLEISDIFPEYYVLKVNQFDDKAKDTLDEWIYFLKNSEIKDSFKAKGLKEAEKVLDIMRLPKADQYGYNRYMDSLSSKASEIFTMQTEAKFQAMDERSVEIAIKSILKSLDNVTISEITGLTLKKINELRNL